MTHLVFQIGEHPYALPAKAVERVVPFVPLKPVPHAPNYLRGLLNYRQTPVPVVDLSILLKNDATPSALSSRILLTTFESRSDIQAPPLIGLLAPSVVETLEIDPQDFEPAGVRIESADYLGPIYATENRLIQRLDLKPLLAEPLRETLIAAPLLADL